MEKAILPGEHRGIHPIAWEVPVMSNLRLHTNLTSFTFFSIFSISQKKKNKVL